MQQYNCIGCHEIERRRVDLSENTIKRTRRLAPPVLNGEGEKVQPQWLFSFLEITLYRSARG